MKIKHTLYIILLTASLIPLYIFASVMIVQNNKNTKSMLQENLRFISESTISSIESFCEARRDTIDMITQYEMIQDAVHSSLDGSISDDDSISYINNMLWERKIHCDFLQSLFIIDTNFNIVASSENITTSTSDYFAHADSDSLNGNFIISDAYQRLIDGEMTTVVAAYSGIFDLNTQNIIGYVVEEIPTSYFDNYRSNTTLWENGLLYLIDNNNFFITAGNPDEPTSDSLTDANDNAIWQKITEHLSCTNHSNTSGQFYFNVFGNEYAIYYAPVHYTDWRIFITINLSSYQKMKTAYRILLGTTVLWTSVVLLLVHYLITKKITKPVHLISGTLENVQLQKNYALRIPYDKNDELGNLSDKINALLAYAEANEVHQQEYQRYLTKKTQLDPMTQLFNKNAVENKIHAMIEQANDTHTRIAVGFLDIDNFRDYNTLYGHQEGDRVIRFVASILKENIDGIVGRNGGDEFLFCRNDERDDYWHCGAGTLIKSGTPDEGCLQSPGTAHCGSEGVPFCSEAWDAISRYIYTALQGGSIMHGWMKDDRVMIACCNDGTRPVIFRIERIDVK